MTNYQKIKEAIKTARSEARDEAERCCSVVRSRGSDLVILDEDGNDILRLCEGDFGEGKKELTDYLAKNLNGKDIYIGGGFDGADSVWDMNNGYHEPMVSDWAIQIDYDLNVITADEEPEEEEVEEEVVEEEENPEEKALTVKLWSNRSTIDHINRVISLEPDYQRRIQMADDRDHHRAELNRIKNRIKEIRA